MKNILRTFFLLFLAFIALSTYGETKPKAIYLSEDSGAILYCYLTSNPTGRAVVDCPGGGYSMWAGDHEGHQWAPWFNERGISYFVVKYRMPHGDRNIPIGDAMNAMKTVRDSALAWHINPEDIGIMGFSAGGHLASTISTHADYAHRPNFSILFYPVITMQEGTHFWSRQFLLGEQPSDSLKDTYSNEKQVRVHQTPPAIILLASDDHVVRPVENAVAYYTAMRKVGNDCSLLIYPFGDHGFGFLNSFPFHNQLLNDLDAWLNAHPSSKLDAVKVACIGNSITEGMGIELPALEGYPAHLQHILGNDYQVKNFGISARTLMNKGDLPYMRESIYDDAKAFNPDIVIIKLGTNDTKPHNWVHKADFKNDYQQLINEIKHLPHHPKIILCSAIPVFKPSWGLNDNIISKEQMPIIRKLAQKNKCQYLDLHTLFTDSQLVQDDGVHPTSEGAKKIAEIIADKIKKL